MREGVGLIASNARFGPIPLRCGFFGLRETGPMRAGKLGGGGAFEVPQRGTAYQPGVKPRVWRTTGAF
jgi:hypothetical protein